MAVVLAVLGAVALAAGVLAQRPSPPAPQVVAAAPTATPSTSSSLSATAAAKPAKPSGSAGAHDHSAGDHDHSAAAHKSAGKPASLAHIAPTRVSIPRLGVSESLIRLGLNPDRTMEVPQDPAKPGWYTGAPIPGELGPAVIAGHVTWDGAPAVFFKVGSLQAGDTVEVDRKDGSTAVFAVTGTEEFRKDAFPTKDVYGFIDHAGLRLITCGGTYDAKAKRYLSNVVVFGKLVSVRA